MITREDVASLVPNAYAGYRPIVAEGVQFFLRHLRPERLGVILAEQAALPPDATPARRLVHLLHHCPALHKLGQVVARRRELDPGLRQRLQRLESMKPRTDMAKIRPVVLRELGPAMRSCHLRIARKAVAEASVAVVIPFTFCRPGEPPSQRRQGVLKVLKPEARAWLHEDLDILGRLADFMDDRREAYGLPPIAFREVFDEVRTILIHEIRVEDEQAHLAAAGRRFAGRYEVRVPEIYSFSTPAVTAMERLFGRKITDAAGESMHVRRRLARALTRSLVAEAIFSREPVTIFHGDPHAGNLMALPDGRLGILDWSLTGTLTRHDRLQISQILTGALCGDASQVAGAIERLAVQPPRVDRLEAVVQQSMIDLRRLLRPTLDWLMRLLDGAARAGVRFRPDLLLFRKSFFTLEGVVADLCPECSMENFITETLIETFAAEWPMRWLSPPFSRDYATHVSNADLLHIAAVAPLRFMAWGIVA